MRIVVLKGGASSEREVSLVSGAEVARALRDKGHTVSEIDAVDELESFSANRGTTGSGVAGGARRTGATGTAASLGRNPGLVRFVSNEELSSCDIVFITLHGGTGENGTVQALFDLMRVPYTGSGMLASALAMDKFLTKLMFERFGIPTPAWRAVENADLAKVELAVSELGGPPVVTKPRDQGSTIGISIVDNPGELKGAVDSALQYSSDILVERYVPGREITVGILGQRALPVLEIAPEAGFYSYDCKYTKGKSKYTVPAEIDAQVASDAKRYALQAFEVLGCADFSRVDFRLPPDGRPQCLEVNTVPGMTGMSLVPMAAAAVGVDFPSLVEEICRLALARRGVVAAARGA